MIRQSSRLQRIEERRNKIKAVWLLMGTLLLVIFSVTVGFKLLTNLFLFMGKVNSANKPTEKNDLIPPSPPELMAPFDATNSASMSVRGSAEPGTTIYLTLNNNSLGSVVTKDNGVFEFNSVKLYDGSNLFSAVAMDESGNRSSVSDQLSVFYSSKAPALSVEIPTDGQHFSGNDPLVHIKGSTDPTVRLTINDRIIILGGEGKFDYVYGLNQGENIIVVNATDDAGNQTQKKLTITYN